jgi:hypothetical protein
MQHTIKTVCWFFLSGAFRIANIAEIRLPFDFFLFICSLSTVSSVKCTSFRGALRNCSVVVVAFDGFVVVIVVVVVVAADEFDVSSSYHYHYQSHSSFFTSSLTPLQNNATTIDTIVIAALASNAGAPLTSVSFSSSTSTALAASTSA